MGYHTWQRDTAAIVETATVTVRTSMQKTVSACLTWVVSAAAVVKYVHDVMLRHTPYRNYAKYFMDDADVSLVMTDGYNCVA